MEWGQKKSVRPIWSMPLANQRYDYVSQYIGSRPQIKNVVEFGCGKGRFIRWLKRMPNVTKIACVDADNQMLEEDIHYNFQPLLHDAMLGREGCPDPLAIEVWNADLTIPSDKFLDADCIVMIEVIEHLTPADVDKATRAIFGYYQPELVIITTPNREFNHLLTYHWETDTVVTAEMQAQAQATFRHLDHKFEWDRAECRAWCEAVCNRFPYRYDLNGVGQLPGSEPYGFCSQVATFHRISAKSDIQGRELDCMDMMLGSLDTAAGPQFLCSYEGSLGFPVLKAEYRIPGRNPLLDKPIKLWSDVPSAQIR